MSDANSNSTVLVIDDDPDLRASVGLLLRSLGIDVQLFASISDFLKSDPPDGPACLVLDVRLPGQSGLDLQRELALAKRELPIIFITGHGDIPMSVQAMKGGAIEFLTKPFRDQDLLDAIQLGLSRDRARRENEEALADLRERFASLSPREREIVIQVARGRLSKQIAHDIGIAEATVKVHRMQGDAEDEGRFASRARPNGRTSSSWRLISRNAPNPTYRLTSHDQVPAFSCIAAHASGKPPGLSPTALNVGLVAVELESYPALPACNRFRHVKSPK